MAEQTIPDAPPHRIRGRRPRWPRPRDWWHAGLHVQIAVNVSARDLLDTALAEPVAAGLARHRLPPHALQLEITERILMTEPGLRRRPIRALAALGVAARLDDFGTGYSSLVRLQRLPVDEVKIDASFVRRMGDVRGRRRIVRSIVDLVRALGPALGRRGRRGPPDRRLRRPPWAATGQGWRSPSPCPPPTPPSGSASTATPPSPASTFSAPSRPSTPPRSPIPRPPDGPAPDSRPGSSRAGQDRQDPKDVRTGSPAQMRPRGPVSPRAPRPGRRVPPRLTAGVENPPDRS